MPKKQKPEAVVQRACLDFLKAERILHYRMNSGMLMAASGRPVRFGVPGMADILAFPRGRIKVPTLDILTIPLPPLWIECKAKKGKQSPEQVAFEAEVQAAGHQYIVVRSAAELIDYIETVRAYQ